MGYCIYFVPIGIGSFKNGFRFNMNDSITTWMKKIYDIWKL